MPELGLYEAMSSLRAVRRLKPAAVPEEVLRRVIEAATWAPTGGNRQPWRVLVVRDPAAKSQLGELYSERWHAFSGAYAKQFETLPEGVVAGAKRMLAAGDYLAAHFHETPAILIFCFDPREMAITDANLDRPSVVGGGSVYPAVQNCLLACRAEGLGCTLTTLLCACEQEVRNLLDIPDPWGTACAIPIGYPRSKGHGPIKRRPVEKMAFADRWDMPFLGTEPEAPA